MQRYIDADEFVKRVIQYPRHSTKTIGLALADTPTADVAEVKHGRWVYGTDPETGERDIKAWTCSLCGEKYPWQPNYCPNCGADMRGEEE